MAAWSATVDRLWPRRQTSSGRCRADPGPATPGPRGENHSVSCRRSGRTTGASRWFSLVKSAMRVGTLCSQRLGPMREFCSWTTSGSRPGHCGSSAKLASPPDCRISAPGADVPAVMILGMGRRCGVPVRSAAGSRGKALAVAPYSSSISWSAACPGARGVLAGSGGEYGCRGRRPSYRRARRRAAG